MPYYAQYFVQNKPINTSYMMFLVNSVQDVG